jgi:hypothetical protein
MCYRFTAFTPLSSALCLPPAFNLTATVKCEIPTHGSCRYYGENRTLLGLVANMRFSMRLIYISLAFHRQFFITSASVTSTCHSKPMIFLKQFGKFSNRSYPTSVQDFFINRSPQFNTRLAPPYPWTFDSSCPARRSKYSTPCKRQQRTITSDLLPRSVGAEQAPAYAFRAHIPRIARWGGYAMR